MFMNQEVYIPGMVGRKILSTLLGLMITAFGAFWLWHPLKLGVTGGAAEAEVIYVEMQKPAQEPVSAFYHRNRRDG
jgi:hypothetical protein